MLKLLTVAGCFLSLISYGQTTTGYFPDKIKTEHYASLVRIPGTRVFMKLPQGYKVWGDLPGISNGTDNNIRVMDLPGTNYDSTITTFSKENFEQKGIKVFEFATLTVNEFPARMALVESKEPNTRILYLVFGNASFVTKISGRFSSNDAASEQKIKQAIYSVYYDASGKSDPFENMGFRLDDSRSSYKLSWTLGGIYIYTPGGTQKKDDNLPSLMISAISYDGSKLTTLADVYAQMYKLKDIKMRNVSNNASNGFPSLKRELYGTVNDTPMVHYQHLVLIGQKVIIVNGNAFDHFRKNIAEFEKLSNTINKR